MEDDQEDDQEDANESHNETALGKVKSVIILHST